MYAHEGDPGETCRDRCGEEKSEAVDEMGVLGEISIPDHYDPASACYKMIRFRRTAGAFRLGIEGSPKGRELASADKLVQVLEKRDDDHERLLVGLDIVKDGLFARQARKAILRGSHSRSALGVARGRG